MSLKVLKQQYSSLRKKLMIQQILVCDNDHSAGGFSIAINCPHVTLAPRGDTLLQGIVPNSLTILWN